MHIGGSRGGHRQGEIACSVMRTADEGCFRRCLAPWGFGTPPTGTTIKAASDVGLGNIASSEILSTMSNMNETIVGASVIKPVFERRMAQTRLVKRMHQKRGLIRPGKGRDPLSTEKPYRETQSRPLLRIPIPEFLAMAHPTRGTGIISGDTVIST